MELRDPGISVRVIVGLTSRNTAGPVRNVPTDPLYLDITLPANSEFTESLPAEHNAMYMKETAVLAPLYP